MEPTILLQSTNGYALVTGARKLHGVAAKASGRLQGRISVDLDPVTAGRPIEGLVTISTRRPLGNDRLEASLVCVEYTKLEHNVLDEPGTWFPNAGLVFSHTEEIYRHDLLVDDGPSVQTDDRRTLAIRIPTPDPMTLRATDGIDSHWIERRSRLPVGLVRARRQRWTLELRLPRPGPDMIREIELPLVYDLDPVVV